MSAPMHVSKTGVDEKRNEVVADNDPTESSNPELDMEPVLPLAVTEMDNLDQVMNNNISSADGNGDNPSESSNPELDAEPVLPLNRAEMQNLDQVINSSSSIALHGNEDGSETNSSVDDVSAVEAEERALLGSGGSDDEAVECLLSDSDGYEELPVECVLSGNEEEAEEITFSDEDDNEEEGSEALMSDEDNSGSYASGLDAQSQEDSENTAEEEGEGALDEDIGMDRSTIPDITLAPPVEVCRIYGDLLQTCTGKKCAYLKLT